jgi:hypothetical protein
MSVAEPQNLSIIRTRLHKSGSTLVFTGDTAVTNDTLEAVVKYLPETKGNYTVERFHSNVIIKDTARTLFVNVNEKDKYILTWVKESCYSKYIYTGAVGNRIGYICEINKPELFMQYNCDHDGYVLDMYISAKNKYSIEVNEYKTKFTCLDKTCISDGLNHFTNSVKRMSTKFHIDDEIKIDYKEPMFLTGQNVFETGPVMNSVDRVDFTSKDVINAILQINVKTECTYKIMSKDYIARPNVFIVVYKNDKAIAEYYFNNNKIVKEFIFNDESIDTFYGKIITDEKTSYYITNVICGWNKQYVFDDKDKLSCIRLIGPYQYVVTVETDNKLTVSFVNDAVNVDVDDIEIALGKPMPQFKFEYLV